MRSGLVIAAILLGGVGTALAPAARAQPAAGPCALVCFPPTVLNQKKCACEQPPLGKPVCSLVCLDPDQTLDARRCACVRRTR